MCLKSWGLFIEEEKEAKALELEENIREEARFMLVELIITCRALGLMRIAHSQSISSARTHELNELIFHLLRNQHTTF